MKRCSYCKQILPKSEFSKDRTKIDGLQNVCKNCKKELNRKWRLNNLAKMRVHLRKWREQNPEKVKATNKKYNSNHLKEHREYARQYRKLYPKRVHAIDYVRYHKLPLASECELCPEDDKNTENLQRHHPDYDFPEIFVTVCPKCHVWVHKSKD